MERGVAKLARHFYFKTKIKTLSNGPHDYWGLAREAHRLRTQYLEFRGSPD